MELKKYNLHDVCEIIPGYAFKSNDFGQGDYIAIKITDIHPPTIELRNATNVCVKPKDARTQIHKGDFVMAMTGATIGKVGLMESEFDNVFINQRVCKFIPKEGFDKSYLYYVLLQPKFRKFIFANIDSSSAQPNIGHPTIYRFEHCFPNVETQRNIASVLSSLDSKISLNRAINRNLEALAKQLYDYWFVQFDFPDENGKPYKSSGGKMVWNEVLKREVPEGWEVKKIGEVLGKVKNTPRLVTNEYLHKGKYPIIDQTRDVYYAGFTNREDAVSTQFPAVVFGDHSCAVKYVNFPFVRGADGTQVMLPNDTRLSVEYLYFFVQNVKISEGYARHYSFLKESPIILPKQEIVDLFKNAVSKWFKMITLNRIEITILTYQRDELLPLLMNGQVAIE